MSNRYNKSTRLVESFEDYTKRFDNDDTALKGEYLPILTGKDSDLESRFEEVISTILQSLSSETVEWNKVFGGIKTLLKSKSEVTTIFEFKDGSSISFDGSIGLMDDEGRYIYYSLSGAHESGRIAQRIKGEIEELAKYYRQGYNDNMIVWEVFSRLNYIPKKTNSLVGKY